MSGGAGGRGGKKSGGGSGRGRPPGAGGPGRGGRGGGRGGGERGRGAAGGSGARGSRRGERGPGPGARPRRGESGSRPAAPRGTRGRPTGADGRVAPKPRKPLGSQKPPQPPPGLVLAEVEQLELTIEKLVAGGDGLGRYLGVPLFVPRTAAGDRVRVRIVERRPDFGRAEVIELLSPGPGRREPPCPHFAECGGCDLQHLDERTQLRVKVEAAVETLRRIARVELPPPAEVLAGEPWGYRLRTQVHTAALGAGVVVGYHARGSRRVVPVHACAVLDPRLEHELLRLGRALKSPAPARIDLALGDDGTVAAAPPVEGLATGELRRRVGDFEYAFDARCFFQGHSGLLPTLVDRAVGSATGELAFDLYGGVGLFALPLARRYRRVVLVEGDRGAARYARRNARAVAADALEVVAQAVESWIGEGLPENADRVLVDPPRDGLAVPVRAALLVRPPRRLTYVSCHPAALARDLNVLGGVFAVESLRFVDLFPQTGHLETLVELVRRG